MTAIHERRSATKRRRRTRGAERTEVATRPRYSRMEAASTEEGRDLSFVLPVSKLPWFLWEFPWRRFKDDVHSVLNEGAGPSKVR